MIDFGLFIFLCFMSICLYGVALIIKDKEK